MADHPDPEKNFSWDTWHRKIFIVAPLLGRKQSPFYILCEGKSMRFTDFIPFDPLSHQIRTHILQLGISSEVTCLQHAERMSCPQALLSVFPFPQTFQICFHLCRIALYWKKVLFLLGISFICICHSWQDPEWMYPVIPLLLITFFSVNQGNMEAAHLGVQLTVEMHSRQQLLTERK